MKKRSKSEQWQMVVVTILVLLILGFNNVIDFFTKLKQAHFFGFLNAIPSDWFNLFVLLLLIYILFENRKVAEKLAGVI